MSASGHIDRLVDVRQYEFVFTVVANLIVGRMRRGGKSRLLRAVSQSQNAPGRCRFLHLQINARPFVADRGSVRQRLRHRSAVFPAHRGGHRSGVMRAWFGRSSRRIRDHRRGIGGFMAKFVVEIWIVLAVDVGGVPRLVPENGFRGIEIGQIDHARRGKCSRDIPDRHYGQEIREAIAAGRRIQAGCTNAIAQFFYPRSSREVRQVGLTKSRVDPGLAVGREHEREPDDRHENHGKQHYQQCDAAFRFSSR